MKEENSAPDFALKVKHSIADKLKSEPAAELAPSPILSASLEKPKFPLSLALGVATGVLLVLSVVLAVFLVKASSDVKVLETEVENNRETIKSLRVRLNESENL